MLTTILLKPINNCYLNLIICCLISEGLYAQINPVQLWENTIGGRYEDNFKAMIACPDGGYLLGGYSNSNISGDKSETCITWDMNDFWIVKIDSIGNVEWENTIGGQDEDKLTCMQRCVDGGYLLGGYSRSPAGFDKTSENRYDYDYWLMKVNASGTPQWDKVFSGNGDYGTDELAAIIPSEDNTFILAGSSSSDAGFEKSENHIGMYGSDYWVIKIDSAGNTIWDNTIGGSRDDELTTIVSTADGGYLLGGYSQSSTGGDKSEDCRDTVPGYLTYDYWIVKINSAGNVMWDKTLGAGSDDILNTILPLSANSYLLGGSSNSAAGYDKTDPWHGSNDYWIIKIDNAGNAIWDKSLGGNYDEYLHTSLLLDSDRIVLGGSSRSPASYDKTEENRDPTFTTSDIWLVCLDTNGYQIWDDVIGGTASDYLVTTLISPDNHFIFGGGSNSDSCAEKSESSIGINDEVDYWIMSESGYDHYFIDTTAFYCSAYYILPWGDTVVAAGTYTDTIAGPYMDTVYSLSLIYTELNDSLYVTDYYIEPYETDADLYEWFDCNSGEIIESSLYPSSFAGGDGEFGLILHKGGCVDTTDCYTLNIGAVNDLPVKNYVEIFPNPGSGIVSVNASFLFSSIEVMDITGRIISRENIAQTNKTDIVLQDVNPGIYIIKVSDSSNSISAFYISE